MTMDGDMADEISNLATGGTGPEGLSPASEKLLPAGGDSAMNAPPAGATLEERLAKLERAHAALQREFTTFKLKVREGHYRS